MSRERFRGNCSAWKGWDSVDQFSQEEIRVTHRHHSWCRYMYTMTSPHTHNLNEASRLKKHLVCAIDHDIEQVGSGNTTIAQSIRRNFSHQVKDPTGGVGGGGGRITRLKENKGGERLRADCSTWKGRGPVDQFSREQVHHQDKQHH